MVMAANDYSLMIVANNGSLFCKYFVMKVCCVLSFLVSFILRILQSPFFIISGKAAHFVGGEGPGNRY